MPQYTTGELAKLCGVSVRTVQFYDTKDLLKPTDLTEGGRRLYSDDDLKKMRLICLLKSLGLSLDSIKGILESKSPGKLLLLLLDEQLKQIDADIGERQKQKEVIETIQNNIRNWETISVNSIGDIEKMMDGKKKLKKTYAVMLAVGIVMDVAEIGAIILWITKGNWVPFAVCMPVAGVLAWLLVRMYYRNVAYICPECNTKFKPGMKEFFFAKHTSKTRKLTCTHCGYNGYCVETAADEETNK